MKLAGLEDFQRAAPISALGKFQDHHMAALSSQGKAIGKSRRRMNPLVAYHNTICQY